MVGDHVIPSRLTAIDYGSVALRHLIWTCELVMVFVTRWQQIAATMKMKVDEFAQ